jgi:benzylsuccinate CoA-transferase BbsF subunit
VVKVEPPKTGSRERNYGSFAGAQPDPETRGLHLYFNINKRGVTLNLEDPRGVDLRMRLLARADIVFNPNPPALNERLGIAWRALCERFPRLIVVSLTYFGTESAYRDPRGGNLVAAQMSGVANESRWWQVTDPENQPPLIPAEHGADHMAA